jgi:hypothetical protein
MAIQLAGIVSKIPWKKLIANTPIILASAEKLFKQFGANDKEKRTKEQNETSIEKRIVGLEKNEEEQAKLVLEMAEQIQQLTKAVRIISLRANLTLILSTISILGLIWLSFAKT